MIQCKIFSTLGWPKLICEIVRWAVGCYYLGLIYNWHCHNTSWLNIKAHHFLAGTWINEHSILLYTHLFWRQTLYILSYAKILTEIPCSHLWNQVFIIFGKPKDLWYVVTNIWLVFLHFVQTEFSSDDLNYGIWSRPCSLHWSQNWGQVISTFRYSSPLTLGLNISQHLDHRTYQIFIQPFRIIAEVLFNIASNVTFEEGNYMWADIWSDFKRCKQTQDHTKPRA